MPETQGKSDPLPEFVLFAFGKEMFIVLVFVVVLREIGVRTLSLKIPPRPTYPTYGVSSRNLFLKLPTSQITTKKTQRMLEYRPRNLPDVYLRRTNL
jgi:hypothetical protein